MAEESKFIKLDGEGLPLFSHTIGEYTYQFTLRDIPEDTQQWLSEVVAAQLNSVHFRADMNATEKFQKAFRKLGGF